MRVVSVSVAGLSLVTCTLKGNIEDISKAEVSFSDPPANMYINTTSYNFKVQVDSSNIGITSDKAVVEVYESKECDPSTIVATNAFSASGTVGTSSMVSLQDGKIYSARVMIKEKDRTFQSECSGWIGVDLQRPNPVTVSYPVGNSYVTTKDLLTVWNPTHDNGIAGLSEVPYRIRLYTQGACGGTPAQTVDAAEAQYKFKKLTHGVVYSVQVSAIDKATNESVLSCSPYTEIDVNAPGFRIEDPTSVSGYSRVSSPKVFFDNDNTAAYWCLTTDLAFAPTSQSEACPGGSGASNGWYTSRPTNVQLPAGDGLKIFGLWIFRSDGSLISNKKINAAITLDQTLPGAFAVTGVGGISDSVYDAYLTSNGNPTFRWTPSADATDYTLEVRTAGNTLVCSQTDIPATPQELTLTNCTNLLDAQAYKVRMISYDVARNFTISPDFNFTVDRSFPGGFTITGVTGGLDTAVDTFLGAGSPVIHYTGSTGATHFKVEVKDAAGSSVVCTAGDQLAPGGLFDYNTEPGVSCSGLAHGQTYRAYVTAYNVGQTATVATNNGFSFQVDTVVPTLTIDSTPLALTSNTFADFSFTTDDALSGIGSVQCQLDGASYTSCTSPVHLTGITDGVHVFNVKSIDAVGNSTVKTHSWRSDTSNPILTINSQPAAFTNSLAIGITFSATDDAGIADYKCSLDGAPLSICNSPLNFVTSEGPHSVVVRATDNTGFYDEKTVNFFADLTNPILTITSQPPAYTSDANISIGFSATDDAGIANFKCSLDGAALSSCSSPYTFTATQGAHTVVVRATDNTGLYDEKTVNFRLDTINPILTIHTQPPAYTTNPNASITFSATDDAGIAMYECGIDGAPLTVCTSPLAFTAAEGAHSVVIRATDNTAFFDEKTVSFRVDNTNPLLTISSQPPAFYHGTTPSVIFAATDAAGISGYSCSLDGAALTSCSSPFTPTVADGNHTIKVRATDNTGLFSEETVSFRSDTTNPVLTITAQPAAYSNTTSASVSFSATDAAGIATFVCAIDGGTAYPCTSPQNWTASQGPHSIMVRATDNTGLFDIKVASFTVDTISPTLNITSGPANPTHTTNTASIAFTSSDATPLTITCSLDSGAYTACSSPANYSGLAAGNHNVVVRAVDSAGNTTSKTHSWTLYTYTWLAGGWSACSAPQPNWWASGFGACSVGQPAYSYGGWGGCSVSCGPGTMYRSQACNYVYGTQYQTVTCPVNNGTQTRTMQCQRNDSSIVADGYCVTAKPATSQACTRGGGSDCAGGAPASSQGCYRGGGADCYGAQATSAACNNGTCTGTWVYGGSNPVDCSNGTYKSYYSGAWYPGVVVGYSCVPKSTGCFQGDGKGKGGGSFYYCQ